MKNRDQKKKTEASPNKNKEIKKDIKESFEKETEEDRNGIIPENMDFKKFLGCGG